MHKYVHKNALILDENKDQHPTNQTIEYLHSLMIFESESRRVNNRSDTLMKRRH